MRIKNNRKKIPLKLLVVAIRKALIKRFKEGT